jgi:hypothetical protein
MTLAGTSIGLTVSGSLTFQATNFTRTYTGTTTFNATTTGKTVTRNGVAFGGDVTFNGVGGEWTLGSSFSCGGSTLTITNGTFDTSASNFSVLAGGFNSSSGTRTINFRNSIITFGGLGQNTTLNSTGLTFIAGNSTISFGSNHDLRVTGGLTFYNAEFLTTSSAFSITGANTFNDLTITRTGSSGSVPVFFTGDQTINGIFEVNTVSPIARLTIASGSGNDTYARGTTRTLTCASIAAMTDVDFSDITIAGAHGTLSGTRLGDCNGNSNITFNAGVNKYWNLAAGGNWQSTAWALSAGGAVSVNNFPLAQDTVILLNTGLTAGQTIFLGDVYNIGTVDFSARTNAVTCQFVNVGSNFFGDFIYGSGVTPTGAVATVLVFANRSIKTINSAGKTFPQSITVDSPSGGIQLVTNNLTLSSTQTTTLTQGTLDLNNLTLSTGLFSSTNSNARTIAFGTGKILCTSTATVWTTANAVNLTTTGTQVVDVTSVGSTAITVTPGLSSEANSISFNFTGGTYALTFLTTANHLVRNVNFTGYAGTWNATGSNVIIYGDLTLSSGMTLTATTNAMQFGATSGTQQITTNTKTLDFPITFNGVGGTFQLQDALTMGSTRTATLTNGTLDLQTYTLSTGLFSSNNSNIRTLAFGTGKIDVTGTGTAWDALTATNFSTSGSKTVNFTSVGSTTITCNSGLSEANAVDFNVTGGTYQFRFGYTSGISSVRNLNFTGYAGTWSGLLGDAYIYGNLIMSATMLVGNSGSKFFAATSGTKTITSNGVSLNLVEFAGVGGTWQLQDAMTVTQSTGTKFVNGTVDLNGKTLTTSVAKTETGTKNITFNGGTIAITTASGISWYNNSPTNFTTTAGTGTGTISMTGATAKSFVGGGSTYNCTINQGGAGDLSITDSNTFNNITNTTQPASVIFSSGQTNTFLSGFSLSGTSGNLITIGSSASTNHTLSKASGTVSVSFCSISKSSGTGGATWQALTINGNVDGGNNTGWDFGAVSSTSNFLMFF